MSSDLFGLLKSKAIISILNGDTHFDKIERPNEIPNEIIIAMPYLSGPNICDISVKFGLAQNYTWSGGAKSRWEYFDAMLNHCISQGNVSNLLSFLFSKSQFNDKLKGLTANEVNHFYNSIVSVVLEKINGELYFGGNELVVIGNKFAIRPIGQHIVVEAPTIQTVDHKYIKDLTERALNDVEQGHFDSAITKSRTVIEEVFCYVIEKRGETPVSSGKISDLYSQTKALYNMHQDKETDKRINTLLSGLNKIIESISQNEE